MKTIHKYVLTPTQTNVPTFERARFLHVNDQHGQVTLWAEVNTLERECVRDVHVVPTGGDVPAGAEYVGTVLLQAGLLVFHVYVGAER